MNALVDSLVSSRVIHSRQVERVFRRLDRKLFCPAGEEDEIVYRDSPAGIGCGQTISAPHMHATCLEWCRAHLAQMPSSQRGSRITILDIGSGSGYLSAAFAALLDDMSLLATEEASNQPQVVGVELYEELARGSIENIRRAAPDLAPFIEIVTDNAYTHREDEKFDFIHVGAAAEEIPQSLIRLMKNGGRMVLPVGDIGGIQHMTIVDKDLDGQGVTSKKTMDVRYVPLVK